MSRQTQLEDLENYPYPKILVVGQQPNSNDPEDPLSPDDKMWAGYRVMSLAGLNPQSYRDTFHRVNINYENEGKFTVSVAQRNRAIDIFKIVKKNDTLIILGTAVEKCFKGFFDSRLEPCIRTTMWKALEHPYLAPGDQFYTVREHWADVYLIPHPSGLNRWWNDPSNTLLATQTLRQIIADHKAKPRPFV